MYELIRLSKAVLKGHRTKEADRLVMDGLFTTLTNMNFDNGAIRKFMDRVRKEIDEEHTAEEWLALIMEFGQVNLKCMELLDKANTETFGTPVPTKVNTDIKKGPFIVVSGHDLEDLHQLLEQTKDFSPLIEQALKHGGYEHDHSMSGINGGHILTTGFAHGTVLANAEKIVTAIKKGAIKVAVALAEVFECGINELPLTLVLSWYEQKAVCILLTLLSLGIKKMYLGPTLPAFLSEGVVKILVEQYDLRPITAPEQDMDAILGRR